MSALAERRGPRFDTSTDIVIKENHTRTGGLWRKGEPAATPRPGRPGRRLRRRRSAYKSNPRRTRLPHRRPHLLHLPRRGCRAAGLRRPRNPLEHHHRPDRVGDPGSYTARLAAGGAPAAGHKLIEKAAELTAAALDHRAERAEGSRVVEEAADVVYHLLALLAERGATPGEVVEDLARRRR